MVLLTREVSTNWGFLTQNPPCLISVQISDERVREYIDLYLKKYGKDIDKARARDELTSLVCLLEAVYKHINKDNKNND